MVGLKVCTTIANTVLESTVRDLYMSDKHSISYATSPAWKILFLNLGKILPCHQVVVVVHTSIPSTYLQSRGRQMSVSLRSAWSAESVPGQASLTEKFCLKNKIKQNPKLYLSSLSVTLVLRMLKQKDFRAWATTDIYSIWTSLWVAVFAGTQASCNQNKQQNLLFLCCWSIHP